MIFLFQLTPYLDATVNLKVVLIYSRIKISAYINKFNSLKLEVLKDYVFLLEIQNDAFKKTSKLKNMGFSQTIDKEIPSKLPFMYPNQIWLKLYFIC